MKVTYSLDYAKMKLDIFTDRKNRSVEFILTMPEYADEIGINYDTLYYFLKMGKSLNKENTGIILKALGKTEKDYLINEESN